MAIVIVDYDAGNLRSVQKGFERIGAAASISREAKIINEATALVLPGVGAFAACMDRLNHYGLIDPIKTYLGSSRPFLGICVGYQLLFESSEEYGNCHGLGAVKGKNVKFDFSAETDKPVANDAPDIPDAPIANIKVPHMGWNQVNQEKDGRLFDGVLDRSDYYFVHSYYPVPADKTVVVATTEYGGVTFASAIEQGSLFGTQFHPEKSQRVGLATLANFARIAE